MVLFSEKHGTYMSPNGSSTFLMLEFFDEEVWQVSSFHMFTSSYTHKVPHDAHGMDEKWELNKPQKWCEPILQCIATGVLSIKDVMSASSEKWGYRGPIDLIRKYFH